MKLNHIYTGDALPVLKSLPSDSLDCCVTSPPYYGLRDYGVAGQTGLEHTPEEYIEKLAAVFMEVRRILKPGGTLWIVIGDSYAGSGRGIGGDINRKGIQPAASYAGEFLKPYKLDTYKSKDLMGIPWLLAFALRNAGWYLRQDIIWHKPNPMPESVRDRCTKAHEYIFLLSKSQKYYFDHNAMLEPANYDNRKKMTHSGSAKYLNHSTGAGVQNISKSGRERWPEAIRGYTKAGVSSLSEQHHSSRMVMIPARNKRSVWTVPAKGFKEAHFATFPPDLIRICIAAGCPPNGVVLDPFFGAGTTGLVARQIGRHYIGIELNEEYVKMAQKRIGVAETEIIDSACVPQKRG